MPINSLQLPSYAAPQSLDFTSLANLGQVYKKSQNEQKLAELGQQLSNGSIDYRTAAGQVAGMGDIGSTLKFLALADERKRLDDERAAHQGFATSIGGIFGGNNPGAPPSGGAEPPVSPTPARERSIAPLPLGGRAPVASSSKVWGDDEAVAAGLYDPLPNQAGRASPSSLGQPPQGMVQAGGMPAQTVAPSPSNNFEGLNASHIPTLVQAAMHPHLPAADREVAKTLLTRALDGSKPDEKVKHLQELARVSGFQGTPLELEMQLRRASKTDVTTNIDQKGETEEAKAAGKAAGERRASMFGAAQSATTNLAGLTRVQTLLDQIDQGKLEPGRMTISAWAKSLGVNDDFAKSLGLNPEKVGTAQAVQSLVNELVIGKLGPGGFPSNNFSDNDRQFLTDIFPKLGNDTRANKIMIEAARRTQNANIERMLDYQSWKDDPTNKSKSFEEFEFGRGQRVSKMDRFGDLRKQAEPFLQSAAPTGSINGIDWRVK